MRQERSVASPLTLSAHIAPLDCHTPRHCPPRYLPSQHSDDFSAVVGMQGAVGFLPPTPSVTFIRGSPACGWVQRRLSCVPSPVVAARRVGGTRPAPSVTQHTAFSPPGLMMSSTPDNVGVLFLCLGNICRSPAAEGMFRSLVSAAPPSPLPIVIDSCGTGGGSSNWCTPGGFSYHEGDPLDSRMSSAAAARGVTLTSRSRPLTAADFDTFDWIVVMDGANEREVARAAAQWGVDMAAARARVVRMLDFVPGGEGRRGKAVPDPYYGGANGFETVLDMLESAGGGLLAHVQALAAERAAERTASEA